MKLLTFFGLLLFAGAIAVGFSGGMPLFDGFRAAEPATLEEFFSAYDGYKELTSAQDYALIGTSLNENPERKRLNESFQALLAPFTADSVRLARANEAIDALDNLNDALRNVDVQSVAVREAIKGLKIKAAGLNAKSEKVQANKLARRAEDKAELIGDITEQSRLILDRTEDITRDIMTAGGVISEAFSEKLRKESSEAEKDNIKFRGLFDEFNAVNTEMRSLLTDLANLSG